MNKTTDFLGYESVVKGMAVKRLLNGKRFKIAAVVGGDSSQTNALLKTYADRVISVISAQQKHQVEAKSVDLIMATNILHHLQDPGSEFKELARILADDGYIILEIPNYTHARNRVKHIIRGKRLPLGPVEVDAKRGDIESVGHNPRTITKQLAHAGLKVEKILSVSNLPGSKSSETMLKPVMLTLEKFLQPALAKAHFGPSVFFLVRKAK